MPENARPVDLSGAYDIVCDNPTIHTTLPNTDLELFYVYKREILALFDIPEMAELERGQYLCTFLYNPFEDFWKGVGRSDKTVFSEEMSQGILRFVKSQNQIDEMTQNPGFQAAFSTNYEMLFTNIAVKTAVLSGHQPRGRWYLEFDMGEDMGGFGQGNMFANLLNIRLRGDKDGLTFSLPHEMHHQILDETRQPENWTWTFGRCIVEEGFCCYFSYIFWDKQYSPALNIDFTEEEWTWCLNHEHKIFSAAKPHLDKTDEDIIHTFHQWHEYVWPDGPDRLTYFIGFRICEAYVSKHGPDSWRELYGQAPDETLLRSGYLSDHPEEEPSHDG